jgi:hypothetical protein
MLPEQFCIYELKLIEVVIGHDIDLEKVCLQVNVHIRYIYKYIYHHHRRMKIDNIGIKKDMIEILSIYRYMICPICCHYSIVCT